MLRASAWGRDPLSGLRPIRATKGGGTAWAQLRPGIGPRLRSVHKSPLPAALPGPLRYPVRFRSGAFVPGSPVRQHGYHRGLRPRPLAGAHGPFSEEVAMSVKPITLDLSTSVFKGIEDSNPFALYVAELPGQGPIPLAKVGLVHNPESLMERMDSLKTAGVLFYPVPVMAFAIQRTTSKTWTPRRTEGRIQGNLKVDQIPHFGEIFACPNASVQELIGAVEVALREHQRSFVPLDIGPLTSLYRKRNQGIWDDFTATRTPGPTCPYAEFRAQAANVPFYGLSGASWNPHRMCELAHLGFMVSDLRVGAGSDPYTCFWDGAGSVTVVPPSSLTAAMAEAEAEQQLALRSRTRTRPSVRLQPKLDPRPRSLRILDEGCFGRDITGPFVLDLDAEASHYRFDAEHLACLGDHAVMPEFGSRFFATGSRAPLPTNVFAIAKEAPRLLPALRFLVGVKHADEREVPLQDYRLPRSLRPPINVVMEAAQALQTVGFEMSAELVAWVLQVWFADQG